MTEAVQSLIFSIPTRSSLDLVVNGTGRALLSFSREASLVILNGRSRGDARGDFTFNNKLGSSVIDYALVSNMLFNRDAVDMRVENTLASEHSLLVLNVAHEVS